MHTAAHTAVLLSLLAATTCNGHGQAAPPSTQPQPRATVSRPAAAAEVGRELLPPSEIYTQLLLPFNRIRDDMGNWSDVELQAFQVLVSQAKQECVRIERTPHEGDEELALARLCTLARDWDGAYSAARWYTRKGAPPADQAHLARGFALLIQSDLNLQNRANAVQHLRELDERSPLTAETAAIFRFSVAAMEIMDLDRAVAIARLEQPRLLAAIVAAPGVELPSAGEVEADAWHTLALLHEAGLAQQETAERAKLLDALSQREIAISPVDGYRAQQARAGYESLGKPMPDLAVTRSSYPLLLRRPAVPGGPALLILQSGDAADVAALANGVDSLRKRLPAGQSATLVLVPDRRAGDAAGPTPAGPAVHAQYSKADLLTALHVENGPLFVVVDASGRITFLGQGSATWLNPQMQAEVLLGRAATPEKPSEP